MEKYDHKKIEEKWQKYWEKEKLYKTSEDKDRPKYYVLDMFPYPSGDGLHAGHVESYTATDIISRYRRLKGENVLHPQGWDAFGLPAENYAIKTKIHPSLTTKKATANFKKQMKMMGFSYDWSREINSSEPAYYKWTQWFFLLLYKNGLAYKKAGKVNWCDSCQTVLANEQAEGGICERCKNSVVQKDLEQWFFKITDFIESKNKTSGLLDGLDKVDWPESTKQAQRNWIGRSEGAEIDFQFENAGEKITVYTTRIDTIFSAAYLILAPDHVLVEKITTSEFRKSIETYKEETGKKTDLERISLQKEKTGVFTGAYVINPANKEKIPVWISDFVLANYGTGAVFADAHDSRDFAMAKKYKIPLKVSIRPQDEALWGKVKKLEECFEGEGILVNSGQFNGLTSSEARQKITKRLAEKGSARFKINYKLRDWLVSRQRYWGAPIPIIYCEKCKNIKNNFIFIHGYDSTCKTPWKLWLKSELEKRGHTFYGPELLNTAKPNLLEQANFILEKAKIDENTIIIGHSLGGAVMMKVLEKVKTKIARAIFLDAVLRPKFNDKERSVVAASSDWKFNYKKIKKAAGEFTVLADKSFKVIPKGQSDELGSIFDARVLYVTPNHRHFSQAETEPEVLRLFENTDSIPVPEKDLPVELPTDVDFMPTGESPLKKSKKFQKVECPRCGAKARREADTMDTFVCSSWYYLRYSDPNNKKEFAGQEMIKKWLPVDLYVGGAEHTVLHLLYARFFTKVLHSLGQIDFDEPFLKLRHQGIILAEDGRKMSKSFGNVVNPDDVVKQYGADALRMFEMFMGPLEDMKPWNTKGIIGLVRFLEKVWSLILDKKLMDCGGGQTPCKNVPAGLPKMLHKTIKKVGEDIEGLHFNTAISAMMIFVNFASKFDTMPRAAAEKFLIILSPFAPHLTEELWSELGHKESIFKQSWPKYNPELVKDETINLVIQVNSKVRDTLEVSADISEEDAKKLALESGKVKKWLLGKEIKKVIFVKGKLVNIVVK